MDTIAPLPGRTGSVAGIESITLDGQRWYFGFDFSLDLVVSPLIADPDAMARFASEHLEQTDGLHDAAYWRELVDWSVDDSELADPEDCDFTSVDLIAGLPALPGHLEYLLGAASGWPDSFLADPEVRQALLDAGVPDTERDDFDCLEYCREALESGDPGKSEAGRYVLTRYLEQVLDAAPANWATVFAALRS